MKGTPGMPLNNGLVSGLLMCGIGMDVFRVIPGKGQIREMDISLKSSEPIAGSPRLRPQWTAVCGRCCER